MSNKNLIKTKLNIEAKPQNSNQILWIYSIKIQFFSTDEDFSRYWSLGPNRQSTKPRAKKHQSSQAI